MRSSTRAVSEGVSLPPSWLLAVEMMSGLPPRSLMPTWKDTRVRVDDLSKITATLCGPASGLGTPAVALHLDGEVEDRGLLGLAQVVVTEEVAGHAEVSWWAPSTDAMLWARIARNSSISASVDDERRRDAQARLVRRR